MHIGWKNCGYHEKAIDRDIERVSPRTRRFVYFAIQIVNSIQL